MHVSKYFAVALLTIAALPFVSSADNAGPMPAAEKGMQIKIGNFTFVPATIEVPAGTHITWINEDDVPHTVVGTDPGTPIKSPALDTDDRYATEFTKPGTYKYFCSLHPHMTGTIVVK